MLIKVVSSILLLASVANAQNMQAGLWKAKSNFELNGLPLPATENEECISKDLAKDPKKTISKELTKRGCVITKWTMKGKKLEASLKCQKDDIEAQGTLAGTVTQKSYDLKGDAEGSFKGIPSFAKLNLTGQWTKPCP